MAYLDKTGLTELWKKVKSYVDANGGGTPTTITGMPSREVLMIAPLFPPPSRTEDCTASPFSSARSNT